jgi:hypothetical protein
MRLAFSFVLVALLSGCGQGNPTRVAPAGAFDSITTDLEIQQREQERLEKLFPEQRELNWDQPSTVVNAYAQLTEFSDDVGPRQISLQP